MRMFIAISIALAACATEPYDQPDLDVSPDTAFANDKAAFDFFIGKGLTNFQAAGIVGNLDQESGVNPSSVQADGPGRGIAQWSVGGRWDTSANDNVKAYAAQQGASMTSLNLQVEFIWYELTTVGYGYSALKATTNVTDATIAFMDKYEICGDCLSSQRVAYAQDVLAAYGQIPYGAAYVSQSWPLASQPAMTVKCGESVAASITLTNTGVDAWNSSTKLGTTEPRDRTSIFAGSDWLAPNRAATAGAVAPGAKGTFKFSFTGPTGAACVPGTYTEYFGLVQEGVAWFSDTGDGGPADNDIEALIDLVPGDATGSGSGSDDGSGSDTGTGSDDNGDNPGSGDGDTTPGAQSAGCAVGGGNTGALLALALVGLVRRRRYARSK
jgi:Phage tail lysozyme